MHQAVENFLDRPWSHKVAFWCVSLGFVGFVFWQYMIKSQWDERNKLQDQLADLQVKIVEQRRIARDLPKFKEEVKRLDKKLGLAVLELPDKREIPDLLSSISTLAIDTGLEVMKFQPTKEEYRDFFAEVPVAVELEGNFHQVATFFDEVGHLARIVNINQITTDILTEAKEEVVVRATCVATTFRYLDESERVQAPSDAGGEARIKKKKKKVT